MMDAYDKIINIIKDAHFLSIEGGSIKNLINNFNNMYNNKELTESLNKIYNEKLKEYQL
jgi:hypothetical protein